MNSTDFFRKYELSDQNVGDSFEGASYVLEENAALSYSFDNENFTKITDQGFDFRLFDEKQETNIYCLYCITDQDWEIRNGSYYHTIPLKFIKEFADHDFFLIPSPGYFLERIQKNWPDILYEPVKYYPKSKEWESKTLFEKREKYSYQKEFRIAVLGKFNGPISLYLGDLSDIAEKIDLTESKRVFVIVEAYQSEKKEFQK
ncbi:MAG: hypothetical protein AB7V25_03930 [Mangrovibacterium sp.]